MRTACIAVAAVCCVALRTKAEWSWAFDEAASRIDMRCGEAEISGTLSFTGPARATGEGSLVADTRWSVCRARDGKDCRLALVDARGNVDGYVAVRASGDGISLLLHHRTAFAYAGRLDFDGAVKYRGDAFACRIAPKANDRVLSVRSGDAVSADDDALFSPSADEALQFSGAVFASGPRRIAFSLDMTDPAANEFSARILRDYYRSRWAPHYRPLDRTRAPRAPTGWLSWNTYFDKAGSKENLAEARFGAEHFKPFGMEFWLIESWQDNSGELPVSKFHNMNLETYAVQFPEGMKWLAGEIRKLGFRPGLWVAPFGTGNADFYASHRDWFLHRPDGKPVSSWNGRYTLDPTVAAAREHLTGIFSKASRDWGYEMFKIDGMSGRNEGYCAHLYERPEIRALFADPSCPNPFELCVKAFRTGIGEDRVFLACQGHFTGAEAGYADCSRTGADIVHPNQPVKWANIMLQARCTINQIFVHSVVFWADPDCMLVNQAALGREQAQVETTIVALPGQQTFAGDRLAELAPDRVRLIQQALPVCDTHPGRLYPQFGHLPVWDLHVKRGFGDWHVVALFNWGDEEKTVGCEWSEIGEPAGRRFLAWEFWNGEWLGEKSGSVGLPVPPRSVRLVCLRPAMDRPQVLTSDRHVTQGGVELEDESWSGSRLSVKVAVVGGFPQTLRIAVPEGFSVSRAEAAGAEVSPRAEAGGRVLALTLSSDRSATVRVDLDFKFAPPPSSP